MSRRNRKRQQDDSAERSHGETDMIKKQSDGYHVLSSKGRNLGGPYATLEEAKKRLQQIEFFKHRDAKTQYARH
jgi:hypothetical protein